MSGPSDSDRDFPQKGRRRVIAPASIGWVGTGSPDREAEAIAALGPGAVLMMGDNPALPPMPAKPTLLDFFRLRFLGGAAADLSARHLLHSAKLAMDAGHDDKIVAACLLHDISLCCLIRSDHGYWGAQMIAPYVSAEIAWAVRYHQCLRYVADESVGYPYPEAYKTFFGADYRPPDYIARDAAMARNHRWYMSARLVTLNDVYLFDAAEALDPAIFTDIIGRCFKQPEEGLGFDDSPVAHMWRAMIWPNNFL